MKIQQASYDQTILRIKRDISLLTESLSKAQDEANRQAGANQGSIIKVALVRNESL